MSRVLVLSTALLLAACPDGETDSMCQDAPVTTWDNFGSGFMTENCQTCHATEAENRNGAPSNVVFDTEADVAAHLDRVLLLATGSMPSMPPQGGVSEEDRQRLEIWLTCFPPQP